MVFLLSSGIGYSTFKKLSSLGITTVSELRDCQLETLVAEFGTTAATLMKQLSQGVDPSPVVATGQPRV